MNWLKKDTMKATVMTVAFVVSIIAFQQKTIINYDKLIALFIALSWLVILIENWNGKLTKLVSYFVFLCTLWNLKDECFGTPTEMNLSEIIFGFLCIISLLILIFKSLKKE